MRRTSRLVGTTLGVVLALAAAPALAANAIQLENRKSVDETRDDWMPPVDAKGEPTTIANNGDIDGYPSRWSLKNGDTLGLRVSTTAPKFRTRVYRIGWYGGLGSRLVHDVAETAGARQAFPAEDVFTGLAECKWKDSLTLTIPADWVRGHYVVRFTTSTGKEAYTYFVLRDDTSSPRAPLLYVDTLATHEAENPWPLKLDPTTGGQIGGKSADADSSAGAAVKATGDARAALVSLDRPFATNWGLGGWYEWTVPTVQWLEQRGYDVSYADSLDLHEGAVLAGRKAWMDAGHDGYWSMQMWDNLQAARDKGLHLAFFSGNALRYQVRFEAGASGPTSTIVAYKEAAYPSLSGCGTCFDWGGDPEFQAAVAARKAGKTAEQVAHLGRVSAAWGLLTDYEAATDKKVAPPSPIARSSVLLSGLTFGPALPECVTGALPEDPCQGVPWVVQTASHWIYTGKGVPFGLQTDLADGDHLQYLVGYRMDYVPLGTEVERPKGQLVLAATDAATYAGQFGASYYEHASGAQVFVAGTSNWVWGLERGEAGEWGGWPSRPVVKTGVTLGRAVSGITVNVLNHALGRAPQDDLPDPGPPPEEPAASAGCACTTAGARRSPAWLALALPLVFARSARRRRAARGRR